MGNIAALKCESSTIIVKLFTFVGLDLPEYESALIRGRDGKDGRDGRDGKDGENGQDGERGRDGRDGRDGKGEA